MTGCDDGTVQLWPINGPFQRAAGIINAHTAQVTSIQFNRDLTQILTRGKDNSMCLFDRRTMKPLCRIDDLPCSDNADAIFSPDFTMVATGTAIAKKGEKSRLCVYDAQVFEPIRSMEFAHSIAKVNWNAEINQIVVGLEDGSVRVLFDSNASVKGAKLIVRKKAKVDDVDEWRPSAIEVTDMDDRMFAWKNNPFNRNKNKARMTKNPSVLSAVFALCSRFT